MRIVFTVSIVILGLLSTEASAFVRTMTCDAQGGQNACGPDQIPIPISWEERCVVYHINQNGTSQFPLEEATIAIINSFESWNEPDCSYLKLMYGGLTDDGTAGFRPAAGIEGNANVIHFRDSDWRHDRIALALTLITTDVNTGRILDVDMEINTTYHPFSVRGDPPRNQHDLINTITHEAGHLIGLNHSNERQATMFANAALSEVRKRDLHQDDLDGICSIFPAGFPSGEGVCAGAPIGYFERPLAEDLKDDSGCTCAVATPPSTPFNWLFLGFAACVFGFLKRRD